jgi:hypothetical protein
MFAYIMSGGPAMVIQLLITLVIIVLIVRKSLQVYSPSPPATGDLDRGLHAILFWGVFTFVLGVYGQLAGIYSALGAIVAAADVSPGIIAEGMAISFRPTLFGLVVMMLSAVVWLLLNDRRRKLTADTV